MSRFDVAHIREQGVGLIIIPPNDSFRLKNSNEQNGIVDALSIRSPRTDLSRTIVSVLGNGGWANGIHCSPEQALGF